MPARVSPTIGFVHGATLAAVAVLVIAGVVAAVNESAAISYVVEFIVAIPVVVVLVVVIPRPAALLIQCLTPSAFTAAAVGWTPPAEGSGMEAPPTPVRRATVHGGPVRGAASSAVDPAPGGRAPRPRAVQNNWWTRIMRRGGWIGSWSSPGSGSPRPGLSAPQEASGPPAHAHAPSSPSVLRPTPRDQQPPLSPIGSEDAVPVIPPRASLNALAESSSILLELFSQGSHDNDNDTVSDEYHALLANATASVLTIHARIRRAREIVVPEPDCIICYAESADTVFMPCKHLVVCAVCISCARVGGWLES